MKYFIEDTTLTDIADAVREKEESTQRIPVLELAGRIRDIQSGAQLAVTLNEDGTQNLSILDDGKVFDLPSLTADADATPEDVAEGKVFYAKGYRYVGAGGGEPVLLWTNANPTSAFPAQTVTVPSGYDAYLIECRAGIYNEASSVVYIPTGSENAIVASMYKGSYGPFGYSRYVTVSNTGNITFTAGRLLNDSTNTYADSCVPTRIWGVKFTL